MSVEIRHAIADDADAVLEAYEWLFEAPGRKPPDYSAEDARERLSAAIESDEAAVLIALEGEAIVGFAAVYLTYPSIRFGQRAWVEDLAVDPSRRSQGIGAKLLEAALDWAVEHDVAILGLESADARTDAHRFYERQQPRWRSRSFGWPVHRSG